MPKVRSPERDKAFEIYKEHNGEIQLREISKILNTPEKTISGWKSKDKWDEVLNGVLQKNMKYSNKKRVPNKQERKELKKLDLDETGLTEKQKLFCLYYVKNFNATQAAIRAGYSPDTAGVIGYENLTKPQIKTEITRLKELKRQSIMINEDDIVERYMRIAFADMTDFVEFGQEEVPVMGMFGPVEVKDEETGEKTPLTKIINVVKFKASDVVDGGLICQIKQGKDGASIKLEDRQKALDWLANFFEMNPEHKHKKAYDEQKLDIERERLAIEQGKAKADQIGNDVKIVIEGDAEEWSQ